MGVIKEKYKQTEVGLIPSDWEVTTFEMIADKGKKWSITGGPFGSNLKVSDYTNDGVQIVQLQNIGDGIFLNESQVFTSEEKANELLSCNIYPNEIIISKMGDPVARACFIPDEAKRYLMASDGIRLVVNEKEFSKKFIHDYINSLYFRKRAFENSRGSTRLRIGLPELKSLLVIKPKLSEQNAIATALSDADALISSLEKLIAKKRMIKQGAMQQLLQPKEGWGVKILGESSEIARGGSPRPIEDFLTNQTDGINWIKIGDVGKGAKYIETTEEKIKPDGISRSRYVKEGDFLLSNSMSFGRPYILKTNGCIHDGWLVIQNYKDNFDSDFLYYVLSSEFVLSQYKAMASGSSVLNLNKEIVKKVKINCPKSKEEQTRIATILSDMDAEIAALEAKLEKYKRVKLGMMQNLLTGRIRLV